MAWYNPFRRKQDDEELAAPQYAAAEDGVAIAAEAPLPIVKDRNVQKDNLPRFRGSASESRQAGTLRSSLRSRVRDSFTPTQPVDNLRLFAGREDALRSLIRSIEDQRLHVVVYGDRGIGKTSLLRIFSQVAREADYHICYHSCGQDETFTETFRAIAANIPALLDERYDPTSSTVEERKTMGDLLPPGELTVGQISALFSHISNSRVIVMLDEFDRSSDGEFRRNIAELVKNLSDRSIRVQLVLAGVASNLAELIGYIPSIRRNIIGLPVAPMTEQEVRSLIRIGQNMSGLTFSQTAIDRVIEAAQGSPYIASMLGQYASFGAVDSNALSVTDAHVNDAIALAVDQLRQRVSERSLHAIDRIYAEGHGPFLVSLARKALSALGRAEVEDEAKAATVRNWFIDRHGLLAPIDDEPLKFHFREESVPTYLTLLSAKLGSIQDE
ncbi:ATP-binding protein [Sphingomonas sp. BGYR3]|uniref:AAA family ATPase n=1 Tax=Sphingomonas sp. BGYR3 TaxID=2975483 RepID=UPI0021A6384C|nr:ATP-binding protein [Sphingomonas sp. BGYR3]MDG5489269.1 ATP-binding protein [Sphingomonas sp. BGYR3]